MRIPATLSGLLLMGMALSQGLQVSLAPSNYNGYNISCFGKKDGAIDLSVSGGTPPYTYTWSTGATTQDVSDLPSGFIAVTVRDAASGDARGEISLTEPGKLTLDAVPYVYASGFNISCNNCYNGSIQVTPHDGVSPYSYTWTDGATTQNRSMLDKGSYRVDVTDANGCSYRSENLVLTQPERDDWGKDGNAGTMPGTHFIGTTDNKDVVFKANGSESIRLKANGDVVLSGALPDTVEGPLYRGEGGVLKIGTPTYDDLPGERCRLLNPSFPYWQSTGNAFDNLCVGEDPVLGTLNNGPLKVVTHGVERMRVTEGGAVAIGATAAPEGKLFVRGDLLVRGGTGSDGDIVTSAATATGPVLWARNSQAAWGLSIDSDGRGHILGDWNSPHAVMTFAYDKVGIGTDNMPGDDYNLFVSKGIITEKARIKLIEEWPDYVLKPGYRLMPLQEVEAFITKHGHLPNVPSAEEIMVGGLDVAKTDAMLMEKAEEVMLHLIRMERRLTALEKENTLLRCKLPQSSAIHCWV